MTFDLEHSTSSRKPSSSQLVRMGLLLAWIALASPVWAQERAASSKLEPGSDAPATSATEQEDGLELEAHPFAPVDQLAGACWAATFPNGARDVHCYQWAIQKRFLRDVHRVTTDEGTYRGIYEGETLYGRDAETGALRFWYFNSLGGVSEGTAERLEVTDGLGTRDEEGTSPRERWIFHESYRGQTAGEGHSLELRTVFYREEEKPDRGESYTVVTEVLRDGHWQPREQFVYERLADLTPGEGP
jgi:hypothetical protein